MKKGFLFKGLLVLFLSAGALFGMQDAEKVLIEKAHKQYSNRNYESAIETYRKYLENYPDSVWVDEVSYKIAGWYWVQGKYKEAVSEHEKFIKSKPESFLIPNARLGLVRLYTRHINKKEKAEEQANILVRDFENTYFEEMALSWLAEIYGRQKKMDKFKNIVLISLRKYPENFTAAWLHYKLGNMYYDEKKYSKALSEFRRSFKNKSSDLRYDKVAADKIFTVYRAQKDYESAAKWAEECIKRYSDEFSTEYMHYRLILLYLGNLEQQEKAQKFFSEFTKKYPDSKYAGGLKERFNVLEENMKSKQIMKTYRGGGEEEVIELK
ncbi:MAG: tetratricopeptide repeat protein [bacterium]